MAEAGNSEQTVDQDHQETANEKTDSLDKWLLALKEDLASWISRLLKIELTVDSFTSVLDTGVVPCKLANFIQNTGDQFFINNSGYVREGVFPPCGVTFKERGALQGSFIARDNVCNFIRWCRELGVPDVIMFETEDLVSDKNEKAVLLTLLEVARRVFKFGVDPPELVRLENEIDKELENEAEPTPPVKVEKVTALKKKHKSHSLDDLVFEVQEKCKCATRYPVQRISDGKYRVGDSKNLIFVRVMRKHVMVRVGGGWDTLDRYFEKHDPCRIIAQRKTSKASRPPSSTQIHEPFVRSPSSMSMASVSSTDSYDSTSTAYSHMSVCSTPPQTTSKYGHSSRHRTLSGGTSSPTYDRCLSPRRGSRNRHKSPCQSSTPPRTIETQSKLSKKCRSMQDLQRRGSDSQGLVNIATTKQRPSSARRSSATPANDSQAKSVQGTTDKRRKSVAVTPKRDSPSVAAKQRKQSINRSNVTQNRMHNRSKSMQELNKYNLTGPIDDTRKSRPTSTARPRSSSRANERSNSEASRLNVTSQCKTSTTPQTARKNSNSTSCDSPRRRTPVHGSPMSSPRTTRRSSSTPRVSTYSPVNSPRISLRQSSTSRDIQKSNAHPGTTVNSPGTMRRAISNLSSPTTSRIKRSSSFDSKKDESPQILNNGTTKEQMQGKYREETGISSKKQTPEVKNPKKQSRVPIKIPGKQSKHLGQSNRTKPRGVMNMDHPKATQNGYQQERPKKNNQNVTSKFNDDLPTPFDNYSYTAEERASLISDIPLTENESELNLDFSDHQRQNNVCSSGGSTPDTIKTIDSFLGGAVEILSTTTSDYDYPEYESDISGLKSPPSISSEVSISPSPTKEILESSDYRTPSNEDTEVKTNVGIMQRLKSLNVEQSSIKPTLRGKIFTSNEMDDLDAGASLNSSDRLKSLKNFSLVEYSSKEPAERSKFFDIENQCPVELSNGNEDLCQLDSSRKFSLVHALIGSIEKRNEPRQKGGKKPDANQKKSTNVGNTVPIPRVISTQSHTGDEAIAGSSGDAKRFEQMSGQKSSNNTEVIMSSDDLENKESQQVDENDNLRQLPFEGKGYGNKAAPNEMEDQHNSLHLEAVELEQFEQDERSLDKNLAKTQKHKELALGESTTQMQQKLTLEEIMCDMLPDKESYSGDNVTSCEPRFQAFI